MSLFGAEPPRRAPTGHQSHDAGTHTWLTPPEILAALGPFDLDPCACPEPRPWPTAAVHWTREDGPLRRPWPAGARVWLNPPFGPAATLRAFLARMADHNCGTALLFARTDTDAWFRHIWPRASAVCFLRGRPHFYRQSGQRAPFNSGAPVALIAYGDADAQALLASGLDGATVTLRG